ncbi:MAG: undecaprenyl-diphosphatase UppP [Candidatus Omnitrophica bacterium CG11_big_fil_rev_8_21_14_0_20_42_13]|uniref:Undecaprenyl-diphosphatase n=1 Tax=Candidatus Ghiorseimicrobium undicola TaxID=1974746 RepID=A0A2H0LYS7_9BACT|nr:MAG: undecaprenyl-diphosphatase UppP [Candidatus Omnitrophica bacterium CG11_big_fil_rev_8_21_14_0_20_42_13]
MSIYESIILGIVQGLGEFLPISSSGHLIIVPYLFGFKPHSLSFDVMLHLGTFFALLIYFFSDWLKILKEGYLSLKEKTINGPLERKLFWYILLATIPAVIIGLLFEGLAENTFRSPLLVSLVLAGFGVIFYFAQKKNKGVKTLGEMRRGDAFLIGLAQSIAILPGVSRSGATITAALALDLKKEEAVRFSFLLSMPVVFGAAILKLKDIFHDTANIYWYVLLAGFLAALVTGLLSIHFLLQFIKRFSFNLFIVYRIIFGMAVAGIFIFGARL